MHQCLKAFAADWAELMEYEQHYVPALPQPLKEILLSYLSVYGAEGALDRDSFKILFAKDTEIPGASGSELVRFLDLTGLLNPGYTLIDLSKSLNPIRTGKPSLSGALGNLALDKGKTKDTKQYPPDIAEDWEDEANSSTSSTSQDPSHELIPLPTLTLSTPHFPRLTRLSLAHPGPTASWTDLLALSKHLNTLTHLSLAYWPIPSTTPNATTTSMVSKHADGPVALGGSHFYSQLDGDWHEAANILRRLSLNTYCLRWLDLEGCKWLRALTWDYPYVQGKWTGTGNAAYASEPSSRSHDHDSDPTWVRSSAHAGPDWNDAWRQIEYVNIFQGWLPSALPDLISMPSGRIQMSLLTWLREHGHEAEHRCKLRGGMGIASNWVEREKVNESVAAELRRRRKVAEGKWCTFDFGWDPVRRVKLEGDGDI